MFVLHAKVFFLILIDLSILGKERLQKEVLRNTTGFFNS
jgi:hypothetical protein